MDDRRERRVDERFYCINIDKLPGKVKIKGKNSHRKSTFNPDAAQKSLRDQDKETGKFIRLSSEDDEFNDFQCFIRSGHKDRIEQFLKGRSVNVLKSKFFIDMRFNENQHDKDVTRDELRHSSGTYKSVENGNIGMDVADGCISQIQMEQLDLKGFNTRMTINALHLAIFSKQIDSLKCLLDYIFEGGLENGKQPVDTIKDLLAEKITLNYHGRRPDSFSHYDRCLNGMNALHLSCHYFSDAFELIFDTIQMHLQTCPDISNIINDKDKTLQFTPLHIAAKKSLVTTARYLINHGAKVDEGDCENRTPLHRAVKYGNEKIVEFLLECGADPNHKSSRSGNTPLHRASTPKIVRILLNYRADSTIKNDKGIAAYDALFLENDELPEVVMDSYLRTNKKEGESSDLLYVYDLSFFKQTKYEMSRHASMIEYGSKLLFHPLTEAMTRLKWSIRSKIVYLFGVVKLIFALSLTWMVDSKIHKYPLSGNITSTDAIINITTQKFHEKSCHLDENKDDLFAYILVAISVSVLLFNELRQMFENITGYFLNWKNWLDLTMIITASVFLSVDFDCFFDVQRGEVPSVELSAISIFLAWFNLVLLLGYIKTVGIYIYMFINVSKTLLFFILIYLPALIAFALCFYILEPDEFKAFDELFKSVLKIMAMMIGELEYENNFLKTDGHNQPIRTRIILARIMSVAFVCFATIVIMNLLVGLTVSEMPKLKKEAREVILKQNVGSLFQKEIDRTISDVNSSRCQSFCTRFRDFFFNRNATVFSALENASKRNNEEGVSSNSKVCVQPNVKKTLIKSKKKKFWLSISDLLPTFLKETSYKVYFYDEWRMEHGSYTGFNFPKELVENTRKSLVSKNALKEELKRNKDDGFEEEFKKYIRLKGIEKQSKAQ